MPSLHDRDDAQLNLAVSDVRPFVPSREFDVSRRFYAAIGFTTIWTDDETLALLELGDSRIMLQNYFVRDWAHNFMIVIEVADAADWHQHLHEVLGHGEFGDARVSEPVDEEWGARVTYAWDPCGVLLHFTQWLTSPER
ncbi:MAG TPA: hypothetical protein VMM60_15165 [Ilumatobacter sp.]|nr:hypothetical protein [Ilumatobacter sp.]